MSFQKKYLTLYLFFGAAIILFNYRAHAQQVIPDHKIKTNVSTINNSLEYISQLEPKRYEYNTQQYKHLKLPTGKYFGFLAEDFQRVMPHLVSHEVKFYSTGKNSQGTAYIPAVDMEKLIPVLVGAIKEQQKMILQLQEEMTAIKERMQAEATLD